MLSKIMLCFGIFKLNFLILYPRSGCQELGSIDSILFHIVEWVSSQILLNSALFEMKKA